MIILPNKKKNQFFYIFKNKEFVKIHYLYLVNRTHLEDLHIEL